MHMRIPSIIDTHVTVFEYVAPYIALNLSKEL